MELIETMVFAKMKWDGPTTEVAKGGFSISSFIMPINPNKDGPVITSSTLESTKKMVFFFVKKSGLAAKVVKNGFFNSFTYFNFFNLSSK